MKKLILFTPRYQGSATKHSERMKYQMLVRLAKECGRRVKLNCEDKGFIKKIPH